jgi:cytochrome P450
MSAILATFRGLMLVATVLVLVYALRRKLLPKPYPDVPYNANAAKKLLGDVPEMIRHVIRTKRIFVRLPGFPNPRTSRNADNSQCWLTSLTQRHHSPIVQAFVKPGSLPWVIVTDPFESQDILLRRTREFDRSGFFGEFLGGLIPEQHSQFRSDDSRFKNNRNLINHLMAPTFIKEVSAPDVYKSIETLIKVWDVKCGKAQGRTFDAHEDIKFAALDAIFASLFRLPEDESVTIRRLTEAIKQPPLIPRGKDDPVHFAGASVPEIFSAILTLQDLVKIGQLSPVPRSTLRVLSWLPYIKRATAVKDNYIRSKVNECLQLIGNGDEKPHSALHSVLLREREVAIKEGRQPDYQKRAIADEFVGILMAGHDTTATTIAWGVKLLADNPSAQDRLRTELRSAYPGAVDEKRAPTYTELARASIPYLDAIIEEILRHSNTIAFVDRQALQDTTILGRHIPKGTDVFLVANGAGYLRPNMPVNDTERSPGARRSENKTLTGLWDDADVSLFKPERWLILHADTNVEAFDPMAGPTLSFGLGPRGCYGRRLAMQHLKMQFALVVWHFRLLKCAESLSGYDAVQKFAREPTQCFVRLERVEAL